MGKDPWYSSPYINHVAVGGKMNIIEKVQYVIKRGIIALKKKEYKSREIKRPYKKTRLYTPVKPIKSVIKPSGLVKLGISPYMRKKIEREAIRAKRHSDGQKIKWASYTPEQREARLLKMKMGRKHAAIVRGEMI